jgi:HemY protein
MKTLFGILLLLFVAASAALIAIKNPGYVLIAREPFVLETSVAVFLLLEVLVFTILYFGVRLGTRIVHAPHDLARWRQTRRTRKAREAFHTGLAHLLEGEYLEAEKSLLASLHAVDTPQLGYLAAALAAQGQNDPDKRDQYLTHANEQAAGGTLAVDMTQARLQLHAGQHEQALATLARVRAQYPGQAEATRLLIDVYQRLHDWQGLAQLLPDAKRRNLMPKADIEALEAEVQRELLSLTLPAGALDTLHRAWAAVPEALQRRLEIVAVYAAQLIKQGATDECVALLQTAIDEQWNEPLVLLFGMAHGTQPAVQLETAEEWLARRGDSPALLLTLGRLARHNRLHDRARVYLERSLALAASAEAHQELAGLFEETGDSSKALDHYRRALERGYPPLLPVTVRGAHAHPVMGASDYGY